MYKPKPRIHMSTNNTQDQELNQEDNSEKIEIEYHRHGLYYVMPAQIMDTKILNNTEKTCYILLSGLANEEGKCFPSDLYLAERLNVSESQVQRIIKKLDDSGLITRTTKRYYGKKPERTINLIFNFKKVKKKEPDAGNDIRKNAGNDIRKNAWSITIRESEDILESEDRDVHPHSTADKSALGSEDPHFCSIYLLDKLKELRPDRKEPNLKQWDKDFDSMLRIDKIPKEEIIKAIDFTFRSDNTFVVHSPGSLRDKYEKISDHIEIEKKTNKPFNDSIAQTREGILIKKMHDVYLHKYRPRQTGKYQENCLELMNGFLIDRKRNYKAKATLKTLIDELKSERYASNDGFKNCLSIELKEALTVWKTSNMINNPLFKN